MSAVLFASFLTKDEQVLLSRKARHRSCLSRHQCNVLTYMPLGKRLRPLSRQRRVLEKLA